MRKRGSITGRHVAFAALVVVVVNAQLTWWVIFTTGQARDRLDLERSLLEARARAWSEVAAVVEPGAPPKLPEGLELVAATTPESGRPTFPVIGDPQGRSVRPNAAVWQEVLDQYRRRIIMMVSEGGFFAVLLFVFMGLMWRTFRRDVDLERQRQNFLSAVTHELKSPIAAIRVALETVRSGRAGGAAAERFIGNALADTDRLDRLVQKVLQATRFDSRSSGVHLHPQPLGPIVERTLDAFRPAATAAGVLISASIAGDVWARADEEALSIAISNLLENAQKYGGKPAEIKVVLTGSRGDAVLEVSDNGAGIPDDEVELVFDRFYRAGDEMTRSSQGTGLGLYLVQKIVMAHHGTARIVATGSGGTTVRVRIPEVEVGERGP